MMIYNDSVTGVNIPFVTQEMIASAENMPHKRLEIECIDPSKRYAVVVTVSGGCANIVEQLDTVDVLIVDYDNLEASDLEDVDDDILEWLKSNDPSAIPKARQDSRA